ncbi:LOW QUALITY PROTEIN: MP domain-containing protein, partial [Cephalotus follicularis]
NNSILACLRDARHLNFDDSLIGAIETSLCNGAVYFDGYPDWTISLTNKNILETLKINIKLHGYNMLPGSEIIAIIHHVHYKATNSICPKSLVNLLKGETTMMKCLTNDSNILIPQIIKWSDINIPEDWSIQSDTIASHQENIENTSLHSITQNEEGLVKIRVDETIETHSTPEDLKENFNYLNICDENDKKYQFQPHRASTSRIRYGKTNYFDTKTKLSEISGQSSILKGIYTQDNSQDSQEINEPISPTYSEMKPPSQLMAIIIDEPFEINKDLIRKDFLQEKIYVKDIDSLKDSLRMNKIILEQHGNGCDRNDSDKAIANILIAGFTGQIKGWWDNVLTTQQETEILEAIQVNELKEPVLNNNNETIEDVVSTLIYNIANYFVGDPTYLKDRTSDQLSNLRCRKLQDFRWYKDTFMTKV